MRSPSPVPTKNSSANFEAAVYMFKKRMEEERWRATAVQDASGL